MLKKMSLLMVISLGCLIGAGFIAQGAYAAEGNSQYSLEGAKYRLYTDAACTAAAKDADGNEAILTTDAKGKANTLTMAPGTYYAKEVKASRGYKLDPKVYTITVNSADSETDPAGFTSKEPLVYGVPELVVFKTDKTGEAAYTRLAGALFTVKYYDVAAKDEIADASPKDEWVFKTTKKIAPSGAPADSFGAGFDWQNDEPVSSSRPAGSMFYKDENGRRVLPLGWFTIEETRAPDGFKRSNRLCCGHVYQDADGKAVVEIEGAEDDSRLHAKTLIFENEPVNTYIKKTDTGVQTGMAGAKLQLLKGSDVIDEWVTSKEEHKVKGLKAGSYTLRELSAPYGYDISDDASFTAASNQDSRVEVKNSPVTLSTSAVVDSSGKRIGCARKEETITDSVHITGLYPGRQYRVTGRLMDKSTGLPLKDAKNKEITASKEFKATKDVMDVEVRFTVDASALRPGTKAVVFEKLLRVSKVHDETVPVELQKHEDINDAAQTITCPVLSTSASISEDKREVTDVISYEGLLPNENYVFRGWLADTVTGEKVPDSDGSVRLSSGKNTSGKTEMKLSADKYEEVKGHSVTAFQELYIIRNVDGKDTEVLVAAHKDKNDKSQIAVICQDIRIRKVVTGNLGDITKRFEYTAEFSGLTPGKAYEVEGDDEKTFIADPSGRAVIPLALTNGQEVRIKQLPKSSQYRITEKASDHVAAYKLYSEDMAGKGAKIVQVSADNNSDTAKALSTALETVDQFDGTVVVLWENNRDLATVTAVNSNSGIWACAMVLSLAGLVLLAAKQNRFSKEQEEVK